MEKVTGFGMKSSLKLLSLANKTFNSLRNENDQAIYTYNDEYMRHFIRQGIKEGRFVAFNQYSKSPMSNNVFNFIS